MVIPCVGVGAAEMKVLRTLGAYLSSAGGVTRGGFATEPQAAIGRRYHSPHASGRSQRPGREFGSCPT
jgi:hypothetical protein